MITQIMEKVILTTEMLAVQLYISTDVVSPTSASAHFYSQN